MIGQPCVYDLTRVHARAQKLRAKLPNFSLI